MEMPSFTAISNYLTFIVAWLKDVIAAIKAALPTQSFGFDGETVKAEEA